VPLYYTTRETQCIQCFKSVFLEIRNYWIGPFSQPAHIFDQEQKPTEIHGDFNICLCNDTFYGKANVMDYIVAYTKVSGYNVKGIL